MSAYGVKGPIGAGIGFCVLFAAVVVYLVQQASFSVVLIELSVLSVASSLLFSTSRFREIP